MSTYTIRDTAQRSGFSSSALRYYEGIGLVPPAGRTDAGYRLYDDQNLARLAFIRRAKQLGCSLGEITDLVEIWDGERCGPVQRRFHELVTGKIRSARDQISELTAFTSQLQAAATQLDAEPTDGLCGEGCACVAETTASTAVASTSVELGGTAVDGPSGCTLEAGAMPQRIADWQAILDLARRRTTTPRGRRRVEFDAGVDVAELARLVAAERTCCSFLSFAITVDDRGVGLEVDGPEEKMEMIAELFGRPT